MWLGAARARARDEATYEGDLQREAKIKAELKEISELINDLRASLE